MDINQLDNVKAQKPKLYIVLVIGFLLAIAKFFFKDTIPVAVNEIFEYSLLLMGIICSNYCIIVFFVILLLFNSIFLLRLIGVQIQQHYFMETSQAIEEDKVILYVILSLTLIFNIISSIICYQAYKEFKYAVSGQGGEQPTINIPLQQTQQKAKNFEAFKGDGVKIDFNFNRGDQHVQNLRDKYIKREEMIRPSIQRQLEVQQHTEKNMNDRISQLTAINQKKTAEQINSQKNLKFIEYQSDKGQQKYIQISNIQEDPFNPPQYKTKKIPQGPRSPPEPVLKAPPKKLTLEDQKKWKIPPCVSNYKNQKSFLIPMEIRLQTEQKNKQQIKISDKFKQFSEALYDSENRGRKYLQDKQRMEQEQAEELNRIKNDEIDEEYEKLKRQKHDLLDYSSEEESEKKLLKQLISKKVEREVKMGQLEQKRNNKYGEINRDVTEKIALGQTVDDFRNRDLKIDQRLISEKGIDSGYGGSDNFKLYDQPFLKEKVKVNIYTGVQQFNDLGEDEEVFLQKKQIQGKRDRPIQFERSVKDNQQLMKIFLLFCFFRLKLEQPSLELMNGLSKSYLDKFIITQNIIDEMDNIDQNLKNTKEKAKYVDRIQCIVAQKQVNLIIMSQEEFLEQYQSVTLDKIDYAKVQKKIDELIQINETKDSKLKSSIFFIKKLNGQFQEALQDMQKKDQLITVLKEEIIQLERKLRENLLFKIQVENLKTSQKVQIEDKERSVIKLQKENEILKEESQREKQMIKKLREELDTISREKMKFKQKELQFNVEQIKQQEKKNKDLNKEVKSLKNQVSKLKNLNSKLMSRLDEYSKDYRINQVSNLYGDESMVSDFFGKEISKSFNLGKKPQQVKYNFFSTEEFVILKRKKYQKIRVENSYQILTQLIYPKIIKIQHSYSYRQISSTKEHFTKQINEIKTLLTTVQNSKNDLFIHENFCIILQSKQKDKFLMQLIKKLITLIFIQKQFEQKYHQYLERLENRFKIFSEFLNECFFVHFLNQKKQILFLKNQHMISQLKLQENLLKKSLNNQFNSQNRDLH